MSVSQLKSLLCPQHDEAHIAEQRPHADRQLPLNEDTSRGAAPLGYLELVADAECVESMLVAVLRRPAESHRWLPDVTALTQQVNVYVNRIHAVHHDMFGQANAGEEDGEDVARGGGGGAVDDSEQLRRHRYLAHLQEQLQGIRALWPEHFGPNNEPVYRPLFALNAEVRVG